jgi:hypothetical protein
VLSDPAFGDLVCGRLGKMIPVLGGQSRLRKTTGTAVHGWDFANEVRLHEPTMGCENSECFGIGHEGPCVKLPVGSCYPISQKIEWALEIFRLHGEGLLAEASLRSLLEDYRQAIRETWRCMDASGVVAECTDCAVNDGGSCCGSGIEDRFDTVLLLINRLMGCTLPESRYDATGCWFLGEKGCCIVSRHVICINYVCRRLENRIDVGALRELQQRIVRESDASFAAEEAVKRWLRKRGL